MEITKNIIRTILLIVLIPLIGTSSFAQNKKVQKKKVVKAKMVHSKKLAHYRYSHLPKRGSAFKVIHKDAKIIMYNGRKYQYYNPSFQNVEINLERKVWIIKIKTGLSNL